MIAGSLLPAVRLLTRLPVPAPVPDDARAVAASLPYVPLVGLLIGAALAGLDLVLRLALAPAVVDALLLVALGLLTGFFHLDGLADAADGLLCDAPRERRLEIMRDSHVGAFGVSALGLALLLQFAALGALPPAARSSSLMAMGVASRWGLLVLAAVFPYARPAGTGRAVREGATPGRVLLGTLLAIGCLVAVAGLRGPLLLALVALPGLGLGVIATRRLGGLTGDVYGASVVVGEAVVLVAAPGVLGAQA